MGNCCVSSANLNKSSVDKALWKSESQEILSSASKPSHRSSSPSNGRVANRKNVRLNLARLENISADAKRLQAAANEASDLDEYFSGNTSGIMSIDLTQQPENKNSVAVSLVDQKFTANKGDFSTERNRIFSMSTADENLRNPSTSRGSKNKSTLLFGPEIFVNLKEGSISDFYKIGPIIGQGAYGSVSVVTHKITSITRAIKAVKKKYVLKSEEGKFFAEVNLLRELDHPNIMKVYELFQDQDHYYLVTEYIDGGELFDRIQEMEYLPEDMAAEYMKQILSAVAYMHDKQIVHRDLKPENLLLDSKKYDASLKLIDFGTAQKFKPGVKLRERFGTPYYIAPEVLNKSYDEKCDIWSCGVILYILLCGYPPFNGIDDKAIFTSIKSGKYSFSGMKSLHLDPSIIMSMAIEPEWRDVSKEAKDLINKLLIYDSSKRLSAYEALNHVWFQKHVKKQALNKRILNNMSNFNVQNKLKQAILTLIVSQISSQKDKEELQRAFQQIDKDGDGTITFNELLDSYNLIFGDRDVNRLEIMKIFDGTDINKSGKIDYSEFLMAAMDKDKLLSKQKIAQAFAIFDQNGDGYITRGELAAVMGGIQFSEEEWKEILEEVDQNGDEKISKAEFVDFLLNPKANKSSKRQK